MTCRDCFHHEVCSDFRRNICEIDQRRFEEYKINSDGLCGDFKNKACFVELPCKVGDTVYMPWEWDGLKGVAILTINRIVLDFTNKHFVNTDFFSDDEEYWCAYNCGRFDFADFGKTVFLTREEAEAALRERSKK